MIENAAPAARFIGQNVRGLSQLKLEKVVQFMKEQRLLVTYLMETWRVTPKGWESEVLDGFLIIHHGETARSCNHGPDLPTVFTEWANLAQDRTGWHELMT